MDYKTAYNKIIDAYFKDEIRPYISKFCFCGTLYGSSNWYNPEPNSYYTYDDYLFPICMLLTQPEPLTMIKSKMINTKIFIQRC
jgi:hypothetical protein